MAGVNIILFVIYGMNILPENILEQFFEWLSLMWQFPSITF